jgi:small conductance mechanosensitive channel
MTLVDQVLQGHFINPATLFGALFYALVFLLGARVAARALRVAVTQVLERDKRGLIDSMVAAFLTQMGQISIYLLALAFYAHLIPALRALGTALLASVSVASVVLGLAAQSTLGNLIAGISLLLYRPFQVGDRVQVNAPTGLETGVVESLTLGYTVLRAVDNRRIVVPNSTMASQVTVNLTSTDPRVMARVPMSIGYEADIGKARQVLLELAHTHPRVLQVVDCPVTQVGPASVTLSLRAWCADTDTAQQVTFALYEQAKQRFDQEGIQPGTDLQALGPWRVSSRKS